MSSSPYPTLFALDIGAKKHAFAWEQESHRDTGVLPNEPKAYGLAGVATPSIQLCCTQ